MDEPMILKVRDVVKHYGGVCAVEGASLDVPRQATVALIGPNGCGKTSLLNTIFGMQKADEGNIYFEGESIDELTPHEIFRRGVVHAFQFPRLFVQLSVLDNMLLAARGNPGDNLWGSLARRGRWQKAEEANYDKAMEVLELMELKRLAHAPAAELSGGQKKLLEMARAFLAEPRLLLLDEPAAGVNPVLAKKVFEKIEHFRRKGVSFLVIEHRMELLMEYAHWVYVMDRGKIVLEGCPRDVAANPLFYEIYIGGDGDPHLPSQ
jgi:branched-chain amino acid transport system ATP-binding protein